MMEDGFPMPESKAFYDGVTDGSFFDATVADSVYMMAEPYFCV